MTLQKSTNHNTRSLPVTHAPTLNSARSYRAVLREPTVSLAGNPHDRPDVATVAILGYN